MMHCSANIFSANFNKLRRHVTSEFFLFNKFKFSRIFPFQQMETMTDPTILAMLAERVADAVFAKFEKRMSAFESELQVKDKRIKILEKSVSRMEGQIDAQEQYSRRTSVRISGVDDASGREDVGRIVATILEKCNSASLSMANVNRAHRVGQRQSAKHQQGKPRPRQIIVQFKVLRLKGRRDALTETATERHAEHFHQ